MSSCKQCPKPKPEPEPNTLKRTTPVLRRLDLNLTELNRLIEKLLDEPKAAFKSTSRALKHAADVISNPASANRSAFSLAKDFSIEVEAFTTNPVRAGRHYAAEDFIRDVGDDSRNSTDAIAADAAFFDNSTDAIAADAAFFDAILRAACYAEYVITEVAHIPPTGRSQYANAHAADVVRNFALALARYFATNNANADADAINAVINAVNELAAKVGELKRFFKDWQSRQLGH